MNTISQRMKTAMAEKQSKMIILGHKRMERKKPGKTNGIERAQKKIKDYKAHGTSRLLNVALQLK